MRKYFIFIIIVITTLLLFGYVNAQEDNQGSTLRVMPQLKNDNGFLVPRQSGAVIGSSTVEGYFSSATSTKFCFEDGTCMTTSAVGGEYWINAGSDAITPTTSVGFIMHASSTVASQLTVSEDVDTTDSYTGLELKPVKRAGVTDGSDSFWSFKATPQFNQAGGVIGTVGGLRLNPQMIAGTASNLYGSFRSTQFDGGTVANIFGNRDYVDIAAGGSITNNVYGNYLQIDADTNPSGTGRVYGYFMVAGGDNIDWALYLANTAPNYMAGDLGIGTDSPDQELEIDSTAGQDVAILFSEGGTERYTMGIDTSPNNDFTLSTGADLTNDIFNANAQGIVVADTATTTYLRVVTNAGIGTNNPAEKLEVDDGTVWIHNSGGDEHVDLKLGEFAGTPGTSLYDVLTDDVGADRLLFRSNRWAADYRFTRGSSGGYRDMVRINADPTAGTNLDLYGDDDDNNLNTRISANGDSYFNNGNVGIGTTTPATELNVVNSSDDSELQIQTFGTNDDARINLYADSGGVSQIRFGDEDDVNIGLLTYDHTDDSMAFRTNNSERARIDSSGKVGIGTSTPDAKLNVVGTTDVAVFEGSSDATVYIDSIAADARLTFQNNGTDEWTMGFDDNDGDSFNIVTGANLGANQMLVIEESGLVGIGTAAPTAKLHVNQIGTGNAFQVDDVASDVSPFIITNTGFTGIGTSTPNAKLHVTNGFSGNVLSADLLVEDDANASFVMLSPDANSSFIYLGSASDTTGAIFNWKYDDLLFQLGTQHTGAEVRFNSDNGVEAMRIDSSQNVGIGETTPAATLDIVGGTANDILLRLSDVTTDATAKDARIGIRHYTNAEEDTAVLFGTNGVSSASLLWGGGTSLFNAVMTQRFYTAANNTTLTGTERMRITSTGKVGIGTTTPATELNVVNSSDDSELQIQTFGTNDDARINLYADSGGVSQIRFGDEDDVNIGLLTYDHTDDSMAFRTNNSERARIDSSGKVGIGTSTPNYELDVYGDVAIDGRGGADVGALTVTNGDVLFAGDNYTGPGGLYKMFWDSSSAGGVGTLNMYYSGISMWGNGGTITGVNAYLQLQDHSSKSYGIDLKTWDTTGYSTKFRLENNGNIGIGTTSPAVLLDVDGVIKTSPAASRTCNTLAAGGIMFDSDDNEFYGCNGTAWEQLSP